MLALRIRQAETALKDGRLDEAFELARSRSVRNHRRGQQLIGRLARALTERGQGHLEADRLKEAAADASKASQLAGNLPEVAGLEAAIADAHTARRQAERKRADRLATARDHIENGRMSMGERLLAEFATHTGTVGKLRDEAEDRRVSIETAVTQARSALDRNDGLAALDALAPIRSLASTKPAIADLLTRATMLATQQIGAAVDEGRVDLADSMLQRLTPVAGDAMPIQELTGVVQQCRAASACVTRNEPRRAVEILRRLTTLRPKARWLADALTDAQQAADRLEQLRGGPLGLLASLSVPDNGETLPVTAPADAKRRQADPRPVPVQAAGGLPARLMLQVDGVGSFLVLRDRRVSIGPASSSRRPDVGLLADAALPTASIERTDEDYFLSADGAVQVNDAPTSRRLLSDQDRIALGPRCRMKFTLPNAASTSAVLHLSGTRLPCGDVRRVILMDRSIIVGPGTSAHIRADQLASPVVLHVRDGRLFCRTDEEVCVNERPLDPHAGIPMGADVWIGQLRLVATAA